MYSKLFRELLNNRVVFVPSEFISYFPAYCAVHLNCHPNRGAIEPDGQYFYID